MPYAIIPTCNGIRNKIADALRNQCARCDDNDNS